jgi:thiamine-phosphate pyrophosphorylase
MLPETTPAVARALEAAAGFALADTDSTIEPVHLFHALMLEDEGRAFLAAVSAGLDLDYYRRAVPVVGSAIPPVGMPLSATTRAAFSLARLLTQQHVDDNAVAGDVLLLALLKTDENLLRSTGSIGLQLDQLAKLVLPPVEATATSHEPLDFSRSVDDAGLARLLDAAANRAREGLRVAEDYCRFVLDDATLCGESKSMRHDLAAALSSLPAGALLTARDTPGDVGTRLSTDAESERASPEDVARVNLKRLQEALRSLEEYGKVHDADIGRSMEALRYRSYTLEKAILASLPARKLLSEARLYLLVTGANCLGPLEYTVMEAAAGGVDIVQLREKGICDRELLERARLMRRWTQKAGILFLVNDRPEIARLAEADGVHLGQDDLAVREARRILGPDALIGVSTHNLDQLRLAVLDGASYVGIGPTFPSGTKDFGELAGLEYIRTAGAATSLAAFAIGGICASNVDEVVRAGCRRIAVSQAILRAENPRAMAVELRRRLATASER